MNPVGARIGTSPSVTPIAPFPGHRRSHEDLIFEYGGDLSVGFGDDRWVALLIVGQSEQRADQGPAPAALPGVLVAADRLAEDAPRVPVEQAPSGHQLHRWITDAQAAPVDDGGEFSLVHEQISG